MAHGYMSSLFYTEVPSWQEVAAMEVFGGLKTHSRFILIVELEGIFVAHQQILEDMFVLLE